MWEYSEKVKELYKEPKNVGFIENADAIGEAGSLSCGDALKLYLKIDEINGQQIITDAKFQTFGCGSAVASSSILTEMVIGKTVEEAKKITNKQIVEELGGLPAQKIHCSVMGYEALEDALKDFTVEGAKIKHGSDEKIICHCFDITEKELVEIIKKENIKTLEHLTEETNAGGACGRCKDLLQELLCEVQKNCCPDGTGTKNATLSQAQFVIMINRVIEKAIATELAKDSGGIELVDVQGKEVYVKLTGACRHCPRSEETLKNFVQEQLRTCVDAEINVVELKDDGEEN
ncbi:nitrogen fixation protein nifU [Candidatus Gastranaerophilus sp. (ex Termes propinquus)]|nr:nitrogen fixation protein nifU [Candidatus Gastranaerophilus sp. (ex Termes propinquus)]